MSLSETQEAQRKEISSTSNTLWTEQKWQEHFDFVSDVVQRVEVTLLENQIVYRYLSSLYLLGEFEAVYLFCKNRLHHEVDAFANNYWFILDSYLDFGTREEIDLLLKKVSDYFERAREQHQLFFDYSLLSHGYQPLSNKFSDFKSEWLPGLDALHFDFSQNRCFILFDGMAKFVAINTLIPLLQLLKKQKISLLLIRDKKGLAGCRGFGKHYGSLDDSAAALNQQVASYETVFTMGMSGAAMSAIYFGDKIQAKAGLMMAGRNFIPSYEDAIQLKGEQMVWGFYEHLTREQGNLISDVRPILTKERQFYVENVVGITSEFDSLYSPGYENGQNTHQVFVPDGRHNIWFWLIENGQFEKAILEFIKRASINNF
jgi:hypothetical protein